MLEISDVFEYDAMGLRWLGLSANTGSTRVLFIFKVLDKHMLNKVTSCLAMLAATCISPISLADTYNPVKNELTIDSVQVGDTVYLGVVVNVGTILKVGGSRLASSTVTANCTVANFTLSAYNAIQEGMTIDQVNQAMGCQYMPLSTLRGANYVVYVWGVVGQAARVTVWFDVNGTVVTKLGGTFKSAAGF